MNRDSLQPTGWRHEREQATRRRRFRRKAFGLLLTSTLVLGVYAAGGHIAVGVLLGLAWALAGVRR